MLLIDIASNIPSGGPHLSAAVIDIATEVLAARDATDSDWQKIDSQPWAAHRCDCTAWFLAAQVLALTERDRPRPAMALLQLHGVSTEQWHLDRASPAVGALLSSVIAELLISQGQIHEASRHANHALDTGSLTTSTARARSVLALSRALNGEYDEAELELRPLRQLIERPEQPEQFSALLASVLIASARFDAAELDGVAGCLRQCGVPFAAHAADAAAAMAMMIRGEYDVALPQIVYLERRTAARGSYYMVREFLVGMHADSLLARGDARVALTLLRARRSPNGHAICFNMQRSAAFLLCGQDHDALAVTDACVAVTHEHCLRTMTPLLVRRAIAQHRLGDPAALTTFADALTLIARMGVSVTPFLTLPPTELVTLLDRLEPTRPDLHPVTTAVRAQLTSLGATDVSARIPRLTPREQDVVVLLRARRSNAAIAAALGTTAATVKSQLRTLYRKLDVNGREAAVLKLERGGVFVELSAPED